MYRYLDAAVLRAPAWSPDQRPESWPDLTGPEAGRASWQVWLARTWQTPGFAAAVEQASPDLARRVREICAGRQVSTRPSPSSAVRDALSAAGFRPRDTVRFVRRGGSGSYQL